MIGRAGLNTIFTKSNQYVCITEGIDFIARKLGTVAEL